jgi:hypothetical protein
MESAIAVNDLSFVLCPLSFVAEMGEFSVESKSQLDRGGFSSIWVKS